MEDTRYAYTLNPLRPIKGIAGLRVIRTGTTLRLTKEEVKIAMKNGHVYRRFANEGINQRVTGDNLDRLHNEKYMTEKEYKTFLEEANSIVDVENKSDIETVVDDSVEVSDNEPVEVEDPVYEEDVEDTVEVVNNNTSNLDINENEDSDVFDDEQGAEQPDDGNIEVTSDEIIYESSDLGESSEDSDEYDEQDADSSKEEQMVDVIDENHHHNDNNTTITANYSGKKKNRKHRN